MARNHKENHEGSQDRNPKTALAFGLFGETLGALALMFRGYRIIARRHRTPVGEIDIVARRGNVLVFVEVKARGDAKTAAMAVTRRQQARITRAAEAFLQSRADLAHLDIRFDALLVARNRWFGGFPTHIVDAWRPGD